MVAPTGLPEGAYRYIVRAYDAAGNISSAPDSAKEYLGDVIVDKTAPTVSSFTVTPLTANPTESFTITYAGSDSGGSGIDLTDKVDPNQDSYQVYRAPNAKDNNNNDIPGTPWTNLGNVTSDNPSPGTYWYGIHIIDRATNCITEDTGADGKGGHCGGVTTDSTTRTDLGPIKVTKLPDITPPLISGGAVTPSNNVGGTLYTNDNTPALSVTTDENATCKFDFTDKAYASMANTFDPSGTKAHSKTLTTAQNDGVKAVFVACRDTASPANTNTKTTIPPRISFSYTLDTVRPGADVNAPIKWKISPNNTTTSNYTTTVSAKTVSSDSALTSVSTASSGSTSANSPTIEVNYYDPGSGIVASPSAPIINFVRFRRIVSCNDAGSNLFEVLCTPTSSSLSFKIKWTQGLDNNTDVIIPLGFIKDNAGNAAIGPNCTDSQNIVRTNSICITINNQAPRILP